MSRGNALCSVSNRTVEGGRDSQARGGTGTGTHLDTADQVSSIDEARLKREMKARFADIKALLGRHVSSARQLLRVLMEHPLRCEAVREGDRKEYRVTGTGSYLPLLPETLAPLNSRQEGCSVVVAVPPYSQLEPPPKLAWGKLIY